MRKYTPEQRERMKRTSKQHYEKNKAAVLARQRAYRLAHVDQYKAYMKAYRANPTRWAKSACWQLRAKAKRLKIPFDLRPCDINVPAVCPFTLKPFDLSTTKNGAPSRQSPSVDRINPRLGYVRGNVRVISMQANNAKNDVTDPEVFKRLYEDALVWSLL